MSATVLGLGTASPPHSIAQPEAAAMAASICAAPAEQTRVLAALYRRSAVQRRASVLLSNGLPAGGVEQAFFGAARSGHDRGPTTGSRLDRYATEAPPLALAASRAALEEAAVSSPDITHLVTVSCTGFVAPGLDAALIAELGLPPTTQRTHVGFMGCHGAINGLRVAAAFANSDPSARVLLCAVELCSLHFHYTTDPDKVVANALFADGAAAAVISGQRPDGQHPRVAACASRLFPDSTDAMTWRIGDHGFEMTLSPRVPELLSGELPEWLDSWLGPLGLGAGDIASWAVHPGGPRVISAVADCLGLPPASMDASRGVLADHGNMSSPTVLFIVDRLRRHHGGLLPLPCVCLAFGPGLVAEAALLI